ncbi:MAG: metal-dependent hydrolase [Haloferacaceae archaeon]
MYRKGHYGVSLLVFAPVEFVLVAADRPTLALATGGTMLWLAMLPDADQRIPGLTHRGATHTLAFAGAVGVAFALAGSLVAPGVAAVTSVGRAAVATYGFALGTLTVGAHLLADLLTPAGVALLWPLSGHRFSLSLTTADDRVWNYGLLVAGVLVAAAVLVAAGAV